MVKKKFDFAEKVELRESRTSRSQITMNEEPQRISMVLAHRRHLIRAGLCRLLEGEQDIEVIGEASTLREKRQLAASLRPRVLLLDMHFSQYPTDSIARVRASSPGTAILVLMAHDEEIDLAPMIAVGAAGFVAKEESPEKMLAAVRRAANGELLYSQEQLVEAERWQRERNERWEHLTRREREVLELIVVGKSNKQIAEELTISEHTVETHVGNLLGKLPASSRAEAVAWVWRHGLIRITDLPEGL